MARGRWLQALASGMASLVDLFPHEPNIRTDRAAIKSDADALARDWAAVGGDLRAAYNVVGEDGPETIIPARTVSGGS